MCLGGPWMSVDALETRGHLGHPWSPRILGFSCRPMQTRGLVTCNLPKHRSHSFHAKGNLLAILKLFLWKRYFQIGSGIIMRLGAPVKSKFDGLKSQISNFMMSEFSGPVGALICQFEYTKLLHIIKENR